MTYGATPRFAGRRSTPWVLAAVVVCAVASGLALYLPADGDPLLPQPSATTGEELVSRQPGVRHGAHGRSPGKPPRRSVPGILDGVVPADTTVFDSSVPAVTKLDPTLLGALRQAAEAAAADGVTFYVDSGWRSRTYQVQLFRDAVSKYGTAGEAARWVAPPGTSAHEHGAAVDVGHADAVGWLSARGAAYGLCQIYANESWHYELLPEAATDGCPAQYPDATYDPRMQQ